MTYESGLVETKAIGERWGRERVLGRESGIAREERRRVIESFF